MNYNEILERCVRFHKAAVAYHQACKLMSIATSRDLDFRVEALQHQAQCMVELCEAEKAIYEVADFDEPAPRRNAVPKQCGMCLHFDPTTCLLGKRLVDAVNECMFEPSQWERKP